MRRRKRRRTVNKLYLTRNIVFIIMVVINSLQIHTMVMRRVGEQPAVRRWAIWNTWDGLKYKVNKYWDIDIPF